MLDFDSWFDYDYTRFLKEQNIMSNEKYVLNICDAYIFCPLFFPPHMKDKNDIVDLTVYNFSFDNSNATMLKYWLAI